MNGSLTSLSFKVIIPAIVQLIINKQDLPIKQGVFKALNADEISLEINTTINSPLPAELDAVTLFLYNKDTKPFSPFGNISIPKTKVGKNTRVEIPRQTVPISNQSELVKWVGSVFDQQDVDLSIKGTPPVSLGALHSEPHLQKTVSIPGLRKLQGFGLTGLTLMLPPDSDGNNIKGTVSIPNFGVLELNLGNLTFNLFSGKTRLGYITVYDADLKPGNNTNNFGGQLFLSSLLPNLGDVLKSQSAALQKGNIDLNVTGNATVVNGQHIKWLEQVLNNRQVTTSVGVVTLLSDVVSGLVGSGNSNTTIIDALEQVLGNNTLIKNIGDRLKAQGSPGNSSGPAANATHVASLLKRATPQDSLMWNMLRLGMRMKMAKR